MGVNNQQKVIIRTKLRRCSRENKVWTFLAWYFVKFNCVKFNGMTLDVETTKKFNLKNKPQTTLTYVKFIVFVSLRSHGINFTFFNTLYMWKGANESVEKRVQRRQEAEEKGKSKVWKSACSNRTRVSLSLSSPRDAYSFSLTPAYAIPKHRSLLSLHDAQIDSFFLSRSLFPHPLSYTLSFPFLPRPCTTPRTHLRGTVQCHANWPEFCFVNWPSSSSNSLVHN